MVKLILHIRSKIQGFIAFRKSSIMSTMNHPRFNHQSGNAMLYVLVGIVLFAALSYTFSRTSRPAGKISMEDATFAAQEIIAYAEKVNGAVQNLMLQNGCLASQINTVARCNIYDLDGGGVVLQTPPAVAQDTAAAAAATAGFYPATGALVGSYILTGNVCVDNVGPGAHATCATDGLKNEELLLIMPWVKTEVCTAINKILGNTAAILEDEGGGFDDTLFTGTFADGFALGAVGFTTYPIGCYLSNDLATPGAGFHFYHTLLAR